MKLTLEFITDYIDNKILENEEILKIKFYDIVVRKKLSKEQVANFLEYSTIRLKNMGYKIYEQGESYRYNWKLKMKEKAFLAFSYYLMNIKKIIE